MTMEEKFNKIEQLFFSKFISCVGNGNIKGTYIPYERIDANGKVYVGDGTINIAYYLTMLYNKYKYYSYTGKDTTDIKYGMLFTLRTLFRLTNNAYYYFSNAFKDNTEIVGEKVNGFFLRDDVDDSSIVSNYTMLTTPANEDPCHSSFVSQDQVWNLNPILYRLFKDFYKKDNGSDNIGTRAYLFGWFINEYIMHYNYTIYNPYLSRAVHFFTYCPTFNTDKVKPWDRQADRKANYKPKIKVKRGANNWYYSGGTKAAYKVFDGTPEKVGKSFREFIYKGIVFTLDKIYEPIYRIITGNDFKHNSYYCYAATSGIWYNANYRERFAKRFNESLTDSIAKGTELFEANIAPLVLDVDSVDIDNLRAYLNAVPEPATSGELTSPILDLSLWYWYLYMNEIDKANITSAALSKAN